jgi:hypothetical protein
MSTGERMTEDDEQQPSRRGPMIALLVIVIGVVGALWLTHVLSSVSRIQDCAMSGRSNCAPISK